MARDNEPTGYNSGDPDCEELVPLLENIEDLVQVTQACQALCHTLKFSHYHLNLAVPVSVGRPTQVVLNTFPKDWQAYYRKCGFCEIDPVVERSNRSTVPFFWDDLQPGARGSGNFLGDAKRFGVGFGLTFPFAAPLNTSGFLSFARPEALPQDLMLRRRWVIRPTWFIIRIFEAVRAYVLRSCGLLTSGMAILTRRERECLALSGDGYTTAQIATLLYIAPRTVAFHIDRSVVKLGVHSRRAALRRALLLGEVDLHVYRGRGALQPCAQRDLKVFAL